MSVLEYLKESFYNGTRTTPTSWRGNGGAKYIEIYKNPTPSEVKDILKDSDYKSIRMVSDSKGNLYAFNGDALHKDILKDLPDDSAMGLVAEPIAHLGNKIDYEIYHDKSNLLDNISIRAKKKYLNNIRIALDGMFQFAETAKKLFSDLYEKD